MKVIIAGSRSITRFRIKDLREFMREIYEENNDFFINEIVSGCARGIDRLGEQYAVTYGIMLHKFPANWEKFGLGAGPIRNEEMAEYADALIAIWDGKSKGTLDMIIQMRTLGKPVYVKVV